MAISTTSGPDDQREAKFRSTGFPHRAQAEHTQPVVWQQQHHRSNKRESHARRPEEGAEQQKEGFKGHAGSLRRVPWDGHGIGPR
jgi:hypothetical protein